MKRVGCKHYTNPSNIQIKKEYPLISDNASKMMPARTITRFDPDQSMNYKIYFILGKRLVPK
tara:strand:- start:3423 stop:3608 length:186 start_codon:yes stop_codon:yes gene_type:complete